MALPVALWATVACFALVSAMLMSSVHAQRGTSRDEQRKEAIANADAAASIALLRQNKMLTSVSGACVTGQEPDYTDPATGLDWCPQQSSADGSWWYRVSAPTASVEGGETVQRITIVAGGTSGEVTRRIAVNSRLMDGRTVFGDERAIGRDFVRVQGDPHVEVDVGSNGDVTMEGSGSICGNIRHGVGDGVEGDGQCAGYTVTEADRDIPPLSEEKRAELYASNSNARLYRCKAPGDPPECQSDTYTRPWRNGEPYDPGIGTVMEGRGTINVGGNGVLVLGGGDYFICKLNLQGELGMAAGSQARIFFDTPEACGLADGESQIVMGGNSRIFSSGYSPEDGRYEMLGLYLFGSPHTQTYVELQGNSGTTNEVFIYAPWTDIDLDGNATWVGAMAGNSISISGNPTITADEGMTLPQIDIPPAYTRERYVECAGAAAEPPDASC